MQGSQSWLLCCVTSDQSLSIPEPQFTICKTAPYMASPTGQQKGSLKMTPVRSSIYWEHSVPGGLVPTTMGQHLDACL